MKTTLLLMIFVILPTLTQGAVLTVPATHITIQRAIIAALPGDTVLVSPGIFRGPGNRNLDLMGKDISLLGRDGAAATLIDCESEGRGFLFDSGEGGDCLVRGFTVMSGSALGFGPAGKGGGLYCAGSSPHIENCIFIGGEAWHGGGLGIEWGAHPTITGCLFAGNSARLDGGALYFVEGGGDFSHCRFRDNHAGEQGDDLYLGDARPTFLRCSFQSAPTGEGDPLLRSGDTGTIGEKEIRRASSPALHPPVHLTAATR
jgi:predicted outer membrane repeat protein